MTERFVTIGDVVVDRVRNCLLRDGEAVRLKPRIMALMEYLMRSEGRVVSRAELMREVWKAHVVDEAIPRAISLLRGALGEGPRAPGLIETIPGQGYRFTGAASATP